jgi:retinol dehydrogenase 12
VYIAGRSTDKANEAIPKLVQETGKTDLHFLKLDLADIPSIMKATKEFLSKEQRLDLLVNNAYDF